MIEINIPQDTPEWLEWRSGGIGGSDVGSILEANPYKTKHQLWLEKTGQAKPADLSNNPRVQRGKRLEDKARGILNVLADREYQPVCAQDDEHDFMRCSLDGLDKDPARGLMICEIKCPSDKVHKATVESDEVPQYYWWQCQYNMMITGALWCDYFSYNPDFADENHRCHMVRLYPDFTLIRQMRLAVVDFWGMVQSGISPDLSEKDAMVDESKEMIIALEHWQIRKQQYDTAKALLDDAKLAVTSLAKHGKVSCHGYTVTQITRVGAVDYSKVPQLEGVDLEPYRKQPTCAYRITPPKTDQR